MCDINVVVVWVLNVELVNYLIELPISQNSILGAMNNFNFSVFISCV